MVDMQKGGSPQDGDGSRPQPETPGSGQPPAPETQAPSYGGPPPPSAPPYGQPPQGHAPYQPYAPGPYAPGPGAPGAPVPPGFKVPGQIDPETGLPYSDKERLTAGLLQLIISLIGLPGIGRLYTGYTAIGLVQLVGAIVGWVLTCILIGLPLAIGMWIWGIVDGIIMLTSRTSTDAQGRVLR